jgi:hypothetical protein
MKIDETPYQFSGTSPIDKLRRPNGGNGLNSGDLDLSFMDLLTSITADTFPAELLPDTQPPSNASKKETTATKTSKSDSTPEKPKLSVVSETNEPDRESFSVTSVDKDLSLLKSQLTDQDMQYMKQAVIPNLPILMGSVPFQTIFPSTPEGEISYRGFEVSNKLAELIEQGYKTGRPIRVELDKDSAVVLKIRDGQVSAEFVSADKGAALALQQELDDLRNKLAQKNLPVGTLASRFQQQSQSGYPHARPDQDDDDSNL